MATVKVGDIKIKCFHVDPNKRYIMFLPKKVYENEAITAAIQAIFDDADARFVGIGLENPDDVKILTVPLKKYAYRKGKTEKAGKEKTK